MAASLFAENIDSPARTQRERDFARLGKLRSERSSWVPRWQKINKVLLPFSGRYFGTNLQQERNRGDKSFGSILDSTATRALRILAAGLMSGMTSPARPWFKLALEDEDLNELDTVKLWLEQVGDLIRNIFNRNNTYRTLHTMYRELGAFATAGNFVAPNFDKTSWHYPMTIGEYYFATDEFWRVKTCYREFEMTVEHIVNQFVRQPDGTANWSKVSTTVKNLWDTGKGHDTNVPVVHVITPRPFDQRERGRLGGKNMPVRSTYYELSAQNEHRETVLSDSGFEEFRVLAPRWDVTGSDPYGWGPSFEALGDMQQLQHEQFRKGQAIDHMSHPSIGVPGEAKGREFDLLPGGVNPLPTVQGGKVQNMLDVRMQLGDLKEDILDVRQRINEAFYADLFLLISGDTRGSPATAMEIAERQSEKMLMLGPVLERLNDELLAPLIDLTFSDLLRSGQLPPPPEELQGHELKIEFVSVLAQAQRAVGLASIDRVIGTVGAIANAKQSSDAWDKIDTDQLTDKYADMLGIDPSIIVSDENVAIIRKQRAQLAQAQQMAAMIPQLATSAKALSDADMTSDNALTRLTGYNTQGATGSQVSGPPGIV